MRTKKTTKKTTKKPAAAKKPTAKKPAAAKKPTAKKPAAAKKPTAKKSTKKANKRKHYATLPSHDQAIRRMAKASGLSMTKTKELLSKAAKGAKGKDRVEPPKRKTHKMNKRATPSLSKAHDRVARDLHVSPSLVHRTMTQHSQRPHYNRNPLDAIYAPNPTFSAGQTAAAIITT
ncbi:MAG TPA: hypothetical protein PKH07_08205, partial [bacterium]|nr:hypothetical protein [bacterium]